MRKTEVYPIELFSLEVQKTVSHDVYREGPVPRANLLTRRHTIQSDCPCQQCQPILL
jgi:hypothetical protein